MRLSIVSVLAPMMLSAMALGDKMLAQTRPGAVVSQAENGAISTEERATIKAQADELLQWGIEQYRVSQFREALGTWQTALKLYKEIGDRVGEVSALGNLGNAYLRLGQYQQAINLYEQVLTNMQDIDSRVGEGLVLGNLGTVYLNLSQYQRAIGLYEQQLVITREIGDKDGEGTALGNLGNAYLIIGEYQQAIELFEQSLEIAQNVGNKIQEGSVLGSFGSLYLNLGQYQQAIVFYEQQRVIAEEIGDRAEEGNALGSLGNAYLSLGQHQRAIRFYEQQQVITQEIGDKDGEGNVLGNLGNAYFSLSQYQEAIELYGQALLITREIGDKDGEGITLSNLGVLFETQGQPELAIAFYKQSIDVRERIRRDLSDQTNLQSYTETIAGTYRALADLLLEQGRILEAQQVLELLKVQELIEFTDDERTGDSLSEIILLPKEEEIIAEYTTLIAFGKQLWDCETNRCANLSTLRTQRDQQFQQYRDAVASLVTFIKDRLNEGDDPDLLLNPTGFATKAKEIIDQQPGTVVIYPLVLDDKLWLLWAADGRVISRREIPVSRTEMGNAVIEFRSLIEDRYSDPDEIKALGQKLYNWLIAPIEAELLANQDIEHLVFSLDRTTRYLPMGALYDGEQYLIDKYTVTTILSAALTDVSSRSPVGTENVSILGAGVSQKFENFNALSHVPIELDAIIREQDQPEDTVGLYSGQQLLDPEFTYTALRDSLGGQQFLHIATHGEFIPGRRDDSYLLMGDGEKLPIPQIETLNTYMEDLHMVVLSACQTALGGPDEEGLEIAGLGYYFLKSEVDAVMASLWNVNDSSTSKLMQAFYQALSESTAAEPITKAEALRTAQLALLNSNKPSDDEAERFKFIYDNAGDAPHPESGLAHPYYWAPFILIGNGL